MSWSAFGALRISDLSGANQIVADETGLAASWEPGNNRFVYVRGDGLFISIVSGGSAALQTPGVGAPTWPEWSSDGEWIYFHGTAPTGIHVYRIRPNGTDLTNLTTAARQGAMPSPSPDGRRVVYVTSRLVVQDLVTGVTQELAGTENARAPRWSPDGSWIAFTREFGSRLMLVRPDGSDLSAVSDRAVNAGVSWSPDSRWVIASTPQLLLIDVPSRTSHVLSWSGNYPAWQR